MCKIMKFILYSSLDIAGKNIGKFLREKKLNEAKIFELNESIVYIKNLPSEILKEFKEGDIIIVASRHKSESKIPTFTAHTPGNFNEAKLGGKEKCLSISPALYLRKAIIELKKENEKHQKDYQVTLEVTHHGPTLDFPIMFIEVGSSEEQWNDLNACKIVVDVIENLCNYKPENEGIKVMIGIGGTHYAPNFTMKLLSENIAVGHIMPKYNFNENLIIEMIKKTIPRPNLALFDWKGLNSDQKKKALTILNKEKIEWKKI